MAANAVLVGSRFSGDTNLTTVAGASTASGSTFVIGLAYDFGTTRSTIGDNKGNTYTQAGSTQTLGGGGSKLELWYCQNGTGGAGHTASATFAGSSFGTIYLLDLTGVTATSFDQTAQASDASSPWTCTTPTLSQADEIAITIMGTGSGAPTYASSNTTIIDKEEDGASFWTSAISKAILSSTSAFTPSFTGGTPTAGILTATFKAAGGGGGGSVVNPLSGRGGGAARPLLQRLSGLFMNPAPAGFFFSDTGLLIPG